MARPNKIGLDYFPFDVNFFSDVKIRKIMRACGPQAASILICLLCNIYRDYGYYIINDNELPFLIADEVGVSEGTVKEVITKALQVGFFDAEKNSVHGVLTSAGIQKRFFLATNRRKEIEILEDFLIDKANNSVNVCNNPINVSNNSVNVCNNEQIEIETESKENIIPPTNVVPPYEGGTGSTAQRFRPPSIEEVRIYISEKGYSVDAEEFVNFYESKGWMIGKNKMKNWHSAVATWQKREKDRAKGGDSRYNRSNDRHNGVTDWE